MRLTTRTAVTFDLTPESYGAMMMEVRELVLNTVTDQLTNDVVQRVMANIRATWSESDMLMNIASNLNYGNLAEYARRGVVQELLDNEKFNSRVMRHIGDATVGVATEAVERVTAIIEAKSNNNSDV